MEIPGKVSLYCPLIDAKGTSATLVSISSEGYYHLEVSIKGKKHVMLVPIGQAALYFAESEPEIPAELEIERCGEDLVVSLQDFAPKIDPKEVKPRDLDEIRPGGLGTHLIREMMDSAEFVRAESGRGNLLRMVKRIR